MDSLGCRPLQESLHGDDQLTQEPLDDWTALGELILHLNLQHVRHQSHKGVFLHQHDLLNIFAQGWVEPYDISVCGVCAHLPVPHWVGGVGYDGRAPLLAMVGELGEAAPLARLDGHLQVRVGVEEHALLQAHRPDVCACKHTVVSIWFC